MGSHTLTVCGERWPQADALVFEKSEVKGRRASRAGRCHLDHLGGQSEHRIAVFVDTVWPGIRCRTVGVEM